MSGTYSFCINKLTHSYLSLSCFLLFFFPCQFPWHKILLADTSDLSLILMRHVPPLYHPNLNNSSISFSRYAFSSDTTLITRQIFFFNFSGTSLWEFTPVSVFAEQEIPGSQCIKVHEYSGKLKRTWHLYVILSYIMLVTNCKFLLRICIL